ncbi:TetR/AcrR family transcriptional regulator [Mycobacterium avium]|uniref:TetR/AcrR family transcriptional regulator n=1 Tax=Mycobacterium avium TaxID=1764 RepID=UPI0009BE62E4|nr:TetR/AcrR family transcriptional regulator [Mycobacterium avium]
MPRRPRIQQTAPPTTDDARERILAAAERCIERHGIRKTTMDDIASEVGSSRPNVYRYFADRDDLLIELITRQARALLDRTHESVSGQSGLPDQIVEGVLYTADHARRDPLTRHITDPDGTSLGRRMITSGTSEMLRAELWDPVLDAAVANNDLPCGLPRADIYLWLGNVTLMVMRGLEEGDGDLKLYRSILRRFFAPAFASANAQVST